MKKHMKRVLSMILAMVMVMSVLPMNVFAAEMLDGADDVGQAEVPILEPGDTAGLQGDVSFSGEEHPEIPPDPTQDPDQGEILWQDLLVELKFVDPDTGAYEAVVTAQSAHSGQDLGTTVFVLAPDFGDKTISDMVANGDLGNNTNNTVGLMDTVTDILKVDAAYIDIQSLNGEKFDSTTTYTIHGTIPNFEAYLKEAGKHANGASLDYSTGVPMTAFLYTAGDRVGYTVGYGTYKPAANPHALLGVPKEIVLAVGQDSATANVSNNERPGYEHSPNITITGMKWGGTGYIDYSGDLPNGMVPNGGDTVGLTVDWGSGSSAVTNITGVITLTYNVVSSDGTVYYRNLEATIPVRTEGPSASLIEVTVWTTDKDDTAGDDRVAENLTTTIKIPDPDGGLAAAGVTSVVLTNAAEYAALTYTEPGWTDDFVGFTADGAPTLEWKISPAGLNDTTFLPDGTTAPIDGSAATAVVTITAGTKKGDYSGAMNIGYVATDGYSTMGHLAVPILVHVKAVQGEAVFHRNLNGNDTPASSAFGGTFTGDAGTKLTTMPGTPIKTNSTFKGWATTNSATTALGPDDIVYGAGMAADGKAAHYYAVWETTVQTYDVTYHLGAGESWPSGVSDPSVTGQTSHKVTADEPTKSGYDFLGWTTVSDGSATEPDPAYAANTVLILSSDVDLYPVWAKLYKVTYAQADATGATAPLITLPGAATSQAGKTVTVSSSVALNFEAQDTSNRWYQFKGWSDGAKTYGPNDTFTMPAQDVILTATWQLVQVTITIVPKDHGADTIPEAWGTEAPYKQTVNKGANLSLPTLTETGWTFKGWATTESGKDSDDNSTIIASNNLTNLQTDATYYAIWEETQYTVTFNPQGGTWGTAPTSGNKTASGTYSENIAVPDTISRENYVFKEWNTVADGTGDTLNTSTDTYGAKGGTTYYAVWTPVYSVTYQDATDTAQHIYPKIGAKLPTDTAKKENDTVTVKYADGYAVGDVKTNDDGLSYEFTGWTIDPEVTLTSGAFSMPGEAVTLTATWSPVMKNVTFKHGGALDSEGNAIDDYVHENSVQLGGNYDIGVNDPEWAGHTFVGWTVTSGATSATGLKKGDTVAKATDNIVLTAVWELDSYTVTYDWGTGTIAGDVPLKLADGSEETKPSNGSVQHGKDYTVTNDILKATTYKGTDGLGWTLKGWKLTSGTATTAVNTVLDPQGTVEGVTSDITLTAVWEAKNLTVTFNANGGAFDPDDAASGDTVANDKGTVTRTVQYGAAVGAAATAPEKADCTFTKYTVNANGSGGDFAATDKITAAKIYYAQWQGDTNDIVVKVTKDGDPWKSQTVALKNQSYAPTENPDGTYTFSDLPVGTYTVVVNNREVKTVTITKAQAGAAEAKFWTVTAAVATAGTGSVAAGASANPTVGTDGTSVVVYNGETAYVNASPATDYKFSAWDKGTSTATAANSVTNVTDTTTVTATFVKKTGSIVVDAKLNTTGTAHTFPDGTTVTLVPHGATLGADTSKEKTQTVNNTTTGSVTFDNLEHDSTTGWDIYVGSTKIADSGTDGVKVTGADGSSVTKHAMYYTVEVKTGGHGDASVTDGTTTVETNYAVSTPVTTNSFVVLEQTSVTWAVGDAELDYAFLNWDGTETNATAYQNVSITAKTSHTANFSKVSFTVKAVVELNEVAQDGDAVGAGKDIVSITAVKTAGDKDDPANLKFSYNSTDKKWVLSGLPTGNTYKVVVTTSTGAFDIATGITADKSDVSGSFFTVETAAKSGYEDNQAVMAVTTPAAADQTKVVVASGTDIALTVDPADGYTHTGWTETNTSNTVSSNAFAPTDVTTAGTGITLTPTFTYTAIIRPTRGGGLYDVDTVVVKTGNTTVGTATEQTDHSWTVSGLTIGTNYDIWVNGYLSDKDTDGINAVEVPIWQISTTDLPASSASTKTVKGVTVIDMPNGAGEADMALAAAAASGYRLRTAAETPATWTSSDATIAAVDAAMDKVTVTNITKDVTLTVNLVKIWSVDVVNADNTEASGALGAPTVAAGEGTISNKTTTGDKAGSYLANSVDDGKNINVSVTPEPGYTPVWSVTTSDGTAIAGKTITGNNGTVAVDQDMIITVDWELTKYDVEVKINLNNTPKADITNPEAPAAPVLYLKKGAEDPIPLQPKGGEGNDGVYTAKVVPGKYAIWSPVASADGATAENTTRAIDFSIADGEGTGNAANLKKTLNYYTVTIEKKFSDDPGDGSFTAPTDVFASHGGSGNLNATNAVASKTILAGEGAATTPVGVAATSANSSTPYYRWDRWDEGDTTKVVTSPIGNYTMPGENALIADGKGDDGITLTAVFQRQFKVTLGAPGAAGSSAAPSGHVQAKFGNDTKYSNGATETYKSALVDADSSVNITALALRNATEQSNYIFSAWDVDKTGETPNGSFADSTDTGVGSTVFTPTADAVVTPSYWLTPTLDPTKQTYHLNYDPTATIPDGKVPAGFIGNVNNLPKYTWTANDAELDGVYITIDGTETKLTKGTEYTMSDAGEIVFQDDYMRKNLKGSDTGISYDITVKSKTPTLADGTQTNKAGTLVIYVTPDPLLSVTIKVNADKAADTPYDSLNLTEGATTEGRKTAIYKEHTEDTITKENKLTFTWYYGDTATSGTDHFEDTTTTAKAKAEAKVATDYKGTALTTTQAGLTNEFSLDGTTIPNAILNDANLKGKYIYAVVEASVTGKGAVITNSIPVDYDAVIAVNKDGAPIDAADAGHYKVFLMESTAAGTNTSYTSVPAGAVPAEHVENTNTYKTGDSTLLGGKTYKVFVNKVEGDDTYYLDTGLTVKTQVSNPTASETINFYSVNNVTTDPKNGVDSANNEVGEKFGDGVTAVPTTVFTTDKGADTITVPDTYGVLTKSAVTAKPGADWDQDYHVDWRSGASASLNFDTESQNHAQDKTNALNTGYTVSNIQAKTYIGARLHQNLYTVTGNVWVIGGGSGGVLVGDDAPTLTSGGHVFKPGTTGLNGNHRNTVTFTVPRSSGVTGSAITKQYVLKAKEKLGSTIIKYIPGQTLPTDNNTTFATVDPLTDDKLADITANTNPAFTIVVEAASYVLHVDEVGETANKHAAHDLPYADTGSDPGVADSGNSFAQRDWTEDYADFEAKTYTITVSNQGNTRLDVDLNIKKSVADATDTANNGYVYGDKATAAGDTATDLNSSLTDEFNQVVFADLVKDFILEPKGAADGKDSKTFKVTIPKGLAVKLAADYAFEFTSIQAGTDAEGATKVYGPSVTYKLTQEVNPLAITAIMAKAKDSTDDTFVVDEAELVVGGVKGATAINAKGVVVADEVEYTWWSGPYADSLDEDKVKAAFDYDNGTFDTTKGYAVAAGIQADGSFKYGEAADQGKAIYVVARPKNILAGTNTGNVVKAVFNYPTHVNAPYDLQIQVNENNAHTKDEDNYNLYLWPDKVVSDGKLVDNPATTFATDGTGVIHATTGTDKTNGLYDVAGLIPGVTYKIYSNAVGGGSNADWRDSGQTVSLADFGETPKVVTYHDVTLSNTLVDNKHYTITSNDDPFYRTVDGTTVTAIGIDGLNAPTAKYGASTTVATSTTSADRWVQEGASINLAYSAWTKDYTFAWTAGATQATNDKDTGSTATATVNDSTTVDTKLTLNLYDLQTYVMGKGSVTKIMLDGGTSGKYTSATADDGFVTGTVNTTSGAASATNSVGAGSYVTFRVPAGTYSVSAETTSGVDLVGYREPHDAANAAATVADLTVGVPEKTTLDVVVNTSGRAMSVADNADEQVTGATKASDTASYKSATDKSSPTINQTITLPYGYDKVDLTLTVTNVGASNTDTLFDVIMNADNVDADSTGKLTVTGPAEGAIKLDGTADLHMADDGTGEKTAVTLSIAKGLEKGSYDSTLVFTFSAVDGTTDADEKASVTYALTVEVVPTEFKAVTVVGDKGTAATEMLPLGEGLKFETYTTGEINDWSSTDPVGPTNLQESDYAYQWYYGTEASPTVTWDKDTATATVSGDMHAITGQTGKTLAASEIAKHPGQNFYLVIYALQDKNVIEAAISAPVSTGFQPVVKIEADGVDQSTVTDFAGDGYTAVLNDGTKDYKTVWSATAGGFVPVNDSDEPISLASDASLTVKVAPAKGLTDTAKLTALTGATLTLNDPDATASYFTVNAVETRDFEAITNLGETFTAMPEMQFALGADNIDDATPVLSGQKVTAKIKTAWTEDYKLTWHTATGATAPDPDDNAYVKTDSGNKTMTALGAAQASGAATTTGSGEVTVSAKTYIGGRLDQNTYTIVSKVSGPTNASIKEVQGDQMDGGETSRRTYQFSKRATDSFVTSSVGSSATILRNNETVTFTVVKGGFDIAATPSDGTVIKSIKWESDGTTVNDGAPLEGMNVAATGNSDVYNVTITVVASNISFSVTDGTVTGSSPDGHGDNEVTRYFSHIDKTHANAANADTTEYTLTLTNPGNKDLTMSLDVFHYDTMPADFSDPTKFLDADKVYSAADPAKNKAELKPDGRVVLTLGDDAVSMMTAGATLPKNDGTDDGELTAGKVILGKDAWAKDSGVFVFRFKGETDVTTETRYAYYVLDLTIDQLPIKTVETDNDGSMVGVDDVISAKGYDATPANDQSLANVEVAVDDAGTKKAASAVNLTDADVKFAWVRVTKNAAKPADTAFTVAADGTLASTTYTDIIQGATYTLTAADMDKDFYLVAYAPNTDDTVTNACKLAISDVVKAKRTAGVKVSLDGTVLPDTLDAVKPDPGYTVYLVERNADGTAKTFDPDHLDGTTGTWGTTWNTTTGRYEAPIDEGKTYDVYALTYKGGTTVVKAIDETLGKQADNSVEPERTVPYWSVKHTANVAVENAHNGFKSYLPGGVATSDNALQNALSVKVSNDRSSTNYTDTLTTDNVPVLEGVNVQVTVDTTKASKATTPETWKGDKANYHTLTAAHWTDTATSKTSGIAYPTASDKVVSTDIPVASGIQNKPLSAKLEQVLFTVKFQIVDITDPAPKDTNAIYSVRLTPGSTETGASFSKTVTTTADANGGITNSGKNGGIVTFEKVPAGALTVQATPLGGSTGMVSGYTWNNKDDIQTGLTGRLTVVIPSVPDTNQDTENNTIRMVEATSMVAWYDDFVPADGSNRVTEDGEKAFEMLTDRTGFERIDKNGGPYLSLIKGYDAVTYTVRLENAGTNSLKYFYLSVDAAAVANLKFDLTKVKWCAQDGTVKDAAKDATAPFEMASHDYLEFDVTIPADQAASGTDYTGAFIPHCDDPKLGGGNYEPVYHVRSQAAFEDGAALVEYGSRNFKTNQNVSLKDWPTDTGEATPTFTYELLTLTGTDAAADAATLAKINAKYGTSLTTLDVKPSWLTLDANTGAFSFTQTVAGTNDPAVGVNVEVNEVGGALPKDFDEYDANAAYQVDDEVVLYLEATNVQGEKFLLSYTVNVEPGKLAIDGGALGANPDPEGKTPVWNDKVDKGWFTYTQVNNQASDAVVKATDITGANTANGNEKDGETLKTDGKVLVGDVHTVTWSVSPDKYTSAGTPADEYTFTVTFTPDATKSNEIKWDYRPASQKVTIASEAPAVGLKFADVMTATDTSDGAVFDVKAGTTYSPAVTDAGTTTSLAPLALELDSAAKRLGERITYLDNEPIYTVTLQRIGTLYDLTLALSDDTVGFEVVNGLPGTPTFNEDGQQTFTVKLTDRDGKGLWAGEHKIKITATGYTTDVAEDQDEDTKITASYELTLTIDPKVVTKLDVKVTDPKTTPDTVKGQTEGDTADRDLTQEDPKGNTPVDPDGTKVTWTSGPDGKNTDVEVTVKIDPNYIYVKDDPDTADTDEDITGHTTLTTDKPADPDRVTVERDETDGDHIVHIKQIIPYLMHDDVKVGAATNKTGPKVDDTRAVNNVTTDDTDLGKYEIHVGSYPVGATFGKVYDLEWSVETNELAAVGAKLLNAAGEAMDFTALTPEDFTASGDHYTLTLDMSEMDFPAAKDYTLVLKAVGAATKGGAKDIQSTYTITVKVGEPTPGYLTFEDANQLNPADKTEAAPHAKRTTIRIPKDTKPEDMVKYVYDVALNAADHMVYDVKVVADKGVPADWSLTPAVPGILDGTQEEVGNVELGVAHSYVLDLSGLDTSANKNETLVLVAKGYSTKEKALAGGEPDVEATYTIEVQVYSGGGGGGGGFTSCPHQVSFLLGLYGTTTDPVMDMVADKAKISKEPTVTAVEGWKFLGWSMTAPTGNASKDAERELVIPKEVSITADTNFYAVYAPAYDLGRPFHEHYVIGYPNGNFGPADNINRASVATIIARAVLPNFVEGADYGNPGGYTDVADHWAASAIAYCSKYGVFNGYEDGTFRPDQSITRQEFALVMARLDGVLTAGNMPFNDIDEAGDWALGGIYTAYIKGWVNGYTDGSFKPLAYIQRDEAVKILNAYLYRGVDAAGLADLKEYIHSGVASNNTENGTDEYMTWPDVPKGHWAYYEIIEAANDHEYTVDETQPKGYTVPEHWDKCWIDERWRYHDDLNDGGPTVGLVRTGFRVWTEA